MNAPWPSTRRITADRMRRCISCLLFGILLMAATASAATKPRILVLTETAGWDHGTRAASYATITGLGVQGGFFVDTATLTDGHFTDAALAGYTAVCFVNTTGTIFTDAEAAAFKRYMESGGGYVGVHASTDAEYGRAWYGEMTGANFNGHPFNIATAKVAVLDKRHASTQFIVGDTLTLTDEWYFWADNPGFKNNQVVDPAKNPGVTVLMNLVESSIAGSTLSGFHPICWYKSYGLGRVWYCGLGHDPQTFGDSLFKKVLLGGIRYAAGMSAVGTNPDRRGMSIGRASPGMSGTTLYDIRGRVVRTENSPGLRGKSGVGAGLYLRVANGARSLSNVVVLGR